MYRIARTRLYCIQRSYTWKQWCLRLWSTFMPPLSISCSHEALNCIVLKMRWPWLSGDDITTWHLLLVVYIPHFVILKWWRHCKLEWMKRAFNATWCYIFYGIQFANWMAWEPKQTTLEGNTGRWSSWHLLPWELEGITSPCCLLIGQYPHYMTLCPQVAIMKSC